MNPLALVVENDAGTRRLLDVLLARFGLQVDIVASGSDALLLLEHVQYDLHLLELLLPGASGLDVLALLGKKRPEHLDRAVVISSAPPADLDLVRRSFPAVRIVRKPFELNDIIEIAQKTADSSSERTLTAFEDYCRRSILAGAKSGVVVRLDGSNVLPVTSFGYAPGALDEFYPLSLNMQVPICASLRNRVPVWIAALSRAPEDYRTLLTAWQKFETRALGVVPLMRNDVVIGAAGWSFREPRLFNETEQQAFFSIAQTLLELPEFRHAGQSQSQHA